MEASLRKLTKEFNLGNLSEAGRIDAESEIRIWYEQTSCSLSCTVIRRGRSSLEARVIQAEVLEGGGHKRNDLGNFVIDDKVYELSEAQKEDINRLLISNRFALPFEYTRDEQREIAASDGGTVLIEMRTARSYGMISYNLATTTTDGQRVIDTVMKIHQKLGLDDRCDFAKP